MKAKVKATGEIVEVERVSKNIFGRTDGIVALYSKDVLDFSLDPQQPQRNCHSKQVKHKIQE